MDFLDTGDLLTLSLTDDGDFFLLTDSEVVCMLCSETGLVFFIEYK